MPIGVSVRLHDEKFSQLFDYKSQLWQMKMDFDNFITVAFPTVTVTDKAVM